VGSLLERLGGSGGPEDAVSTSGNGPAATRSDGTGLERPSEHDGGATFPEGDLITVKGLARSVTNGNPIAGVRVGLIQRGSGAVTKTNLLTWGGTNSEGVFQMNRGVPKGQYTLKARAIGYEDLTLDVRVDRETGNLVLELKPAP
ncbi:MAG: carboxypeptidase regulatory-like domain-containing protein, partial [Blastocatellia bacterium]